MIGHAPTWLVIIGVLVLLFECWALPAYIRESNKNGRLAQEKENES